MKKIILLASVITVVSFASCKKAKTCSCTTTVSNSNPFFNPSASNPASTTTTETSYDKIKKSEANQSCPKTSVTAVNNNESNALDQNTQTTTKSCTLK